MQIRSTKDIKNGLTIPQHHASEREFFRNPPWSGLRKDRIGMAPLKGFLSQLLFDHIRVEFPGVVKDIQNLISETQNALEDLGPASPDIGGSASLPVQGCHELPAGYLGRALRDLFA